MKGSKKSISTITAILFFILSVVPISVFQPAEAFAQYGYEGSDGYGDFWGGEEPAEKPVTDDGMTWENYDYPSGGGDPAGMGDWGDPNTPNEVTDMEETETSTTTFDSETGDPLYSETTTYTEPVEDEPVDWDSSEGDDIIDWESFGESEDYEPPVIDDFASGEMTSPNDPTSDIEAIDELIEEFENEGVIPTPPSMPDTDAIEEEAIDDFMNMGVDDSTLQDETSESDADADDVEQEENTHAEDGNDPSIMEDQGDDVSSTSNLHAERIAKILESIDKKRATIQKLQNNQRKVKKTKQNNRLKKRIANLRLEIRNLKEEMTVS